MFLYFSLTSAILRFALFNALFSFSFNWNRFSFYYSSFRYFKFPYTLSCSNCFTLNLKNLTESSNFIAYLYQSLNSYTCFKRLKSSFGTIFPSTTIDESVVLWCLGPSLRLFYIVKLWFFRPIISCKESIWSSFL